MTPRQRARVSNVLKDPFGQDVKKYLSFDGNMLHLEYVTDGRTVAFKVNPEAYLLQLGAEVAFMRTVYDADVTDPVVKPEDLIFEDQDDT